VCTSVELDRAMPAADLAARWQAALPAVHVIAERDHRAALDRALSGMPSGSGPVVVAGSLYLVGAVRAILVDDPELRDPDRSEDA
jgi:folylpolyglutamate synthase/dihydropteroate synthase